MFNRDDEVEIAVGDVKNLECAYVGQRAKVLEVYKNGDVKLLLKCGHPHIMNEKKLRKRIERKKA